MTFWTGHERAISQVLGVALMVAVVVGLAVVSGVLFFDLAEQRDPQPAATFDVEVEDDGVTHRLVLEGGETLDGDRIRLVDAADSDVFAGETVRSGDETTFYPTDGDVAVVWEGSHGGSHVLGTFEVESTVPEPDKGCPWVDNETNSGSDKLNVDGEVVNCDAETTEDVEVTTSGVIIGDTDSGKTVDADGAEFYGDVEAETLVNLQDGEIYGSVASNDDVKIDNGTVSESIRADDVIEVVGDSSVGGDVESDTDLVKVDSSTVQGNVVSDGSVKLLNATVEGDVYVDSANFDCTDSTINGQDCDEYTPRDPG